MIRKSYICTTTNKENGVLFPVLGHRSSSRAGSPTPSVDVDDAVFEWFRDTETGLFKVSLFIDVSVFISMVNNM